ncbi:Protein CBG11182 [Caenorhabditis briggsae]|uniref:Protein CBG11182 n=1 Tax=Caenorhabditis briggsae TaxID=6238 RepID=A8XCM8_CAEBR|nr:Protein CBG11182 [Caenorhabditis briggsae]CAP30377.2 Protein CBG11182 [Caenorhabditis briggsae]
MSSSSDKLSADDVLNTLEKRNRYILTCILVCGFAWAPLAFTGLCPSFVVKSPENSSFIGVADEFNLTGEATWLADSTTTFYMVGNMIGGMFIPPLADKYGRLPVFVVTVLLMASSGILSAFSNSILMFCIMRLIHGIFYTVSWMIHTASGLAGWVLGYENTPLRLRFFTSVYYGLMWVVGACLLALLAYILPDWRYLMFCISFPNLFVAILIYMTVPESLHYLVSSQQTEKIEAWLEKIRGPKGDITAMDIVEIQDPKGSSFKSLCREMWKHKMFIVYIFVMTYLWIVDTFIYFGLAFYSKNLAGNIYLNFVLMSLVEAPAYVFSPIFMNKYGRKVLISGTHIIAGLSFLGIVLSSEEWHIHFWLLGKFAISCSFMSIYMFASEIFPTDGRNKCIGFCETLSRFGGMLSPYLSHLTAVHALAPAITLSLIAVSGGLLTLVLPETLNTKLPSTIAETASRRQLIDRSDSNSN